MTATVHVVEPGGHGGVYQHAAAVAAALDERGVPVVLHTAVDAEGPFPRTPCFWPFPTTRPAALRRARVAAAWLGLGVPSCVAGVGPGDVVHAEGWFRPAFFVPLVLAARRRGARVVFSPHNTFSRRARPSEERIVGWMARRSAAVLTFSDHDRRRVEAWGARAVHVPLLVRPPRPSPDLVAAWRRRWQAGTVVLLAGQLRPDKGLDLLVRAVARRPGLRLAAVGQDLGALGPARRLAADLDVPMDVDEGYQPLDRFVATLAAADVVACPYRVASQSAVLALAAALGRPTVATDVGGLAELASVTVAPGDPDALARGIGQALRAPAPIPRRTDIDPYLRAYGLALAPTP